METRSSLWLLLSTYPLPLSFFAKDMADLNPQRHSCRRLLRRGQRQLSSSGTRAKWLGLRVVVDKHRKKPTTRSFQKRK